MRGLKITVSVEVKIVSSIRVAQYTRMESGGLFGVDDPSSGSRVVVFAEVK